MDTNSILHRISQPCDLAVNQVVEQMKEAGLTALRTFDLQFGRDNQASCPCPVHGYENCNCQVVVLLIYVEEGKPVTLVAHGDNRETIFAIVDTPQQRPDATTESLIRSCFNNPEETGLKKQTEGSITLT